MTQKTKQPTPTQRWRALPETRRLAICYAIETAIRGDMEAHPELYKRRKARRVA